MLRKKHQYKFRISNNGLTGLTYTWYFNKKSVEQLFAISVSDEEFIPSMASSTTSIIIMPMKWGNLNNFKMTLQVT